MPAPRILAAVALAGVCAASVAAIDPLVRRANAAHSRSGTSIVLPGSDGEATLLFNGWRISPSGRPLPTGDFLLGGALNPDGSTLAIANCGFGGHALHLIDIAHEREIAKIPVFKAWNGIAWSPDGQRLYLAGGISNTECDVWVVDADPGGAWAAKPGFKLTGNDRKRTAVAGLALSPDGTSLYVLNNSDGRLYVLDTRTGDTVAAMAVGDHPIVCRVSGDGKSLYVANWGGREIAVVSMADPRSPSVIDRIAVGEHPNDIAVRGSTLYASCGNSDEVSVVDLNEGRTAESVKTSLTPKSPPGSTPNALAVSPDGRTLYVANADNNDVCVIDVSRPGHSKVAGFMPTGWYPTAVAVSRDGRKLMLCSGKGTGTRPNPATLPIGRSYVGGFRYIGSQLSGMVSFVDAPGPSQLAAYTRQCLANSPYRDTQLGALQSREPTAIPTRVGQRSPIRYVLYIIKENRTYDQVYGDIAKGNGDPNLTLFGRDVTPNQHALAEQYVLLDNLYCNGEVSADGHPWSTSAYATDFTQRSWVLSYSGKGSAAGSDSVGVPHNGYLWDACARKGISYRSYGEYVYATSSAAAPEQRVEGATGLKGHGSPKYVGIGWPKGKPMRDMDRADMFVGEFHDFEKSGTIPRFMVMSLGENHTNGTSPGAFTPKSMVASNDQAVGKIVDAISHSPEWNQFAIFIIEDDAQNGPDHVDAHRTAGLVISPYTRRAAVDSTLYTTASMIRTMELILGLPPLTQYDAAATPMYASFTNRADLTPFNRIDPRISLTDRNPATAYGAQLSARMDWRGFDRAPEDALNRILWHSIKGPEVPMPAPVRRALPSASGRLHDTPSAFAERDSER